MCRMILLQTSMELLPCFLIARMLCVRMSVSPSTTISQKIGTVASLIFISTVPAVPGTQNVLGTFLSNELCNSDLVHGQMVWLREKGFAVRWAWISVALSLSMCINFRNSDRKNNY